MKIRHLAFGLLIVFDTSCFTISTEWTEQLDENLAVASEEIEDLVGDSFSELNGFISNSSSTLVEQFNETLTEGLGEFVYFFGGDALTDGPKEVAVASEEIEDFVEDSFSELNGFISDSSSTLVEQFNETFFGDDFFGDGPVEMITCKADNMDDYKTSVDFNVTLEEPSAMSCSSALSFVENEYSLSVSQQQENALDALMASILEDPRCAMLADLEESLALDSDVDIFEVTKGLRTGNIPDLPEDIFEEMCSKMDGFATCNRDVILPKFINFLNNDEYSGCCVGVDKTEEGKQVISFVTELVEVIDSLLCDIRQPLDGEKPQTCGFTLMQGINDPSADFVTNILPWLQIPANQTCSAFAGESFTNTKGETSFLFPSSPLRNCATGHDKLFSLIKSTYGRLEAILDDAMMKEMEDIMEDIPLGDMFTAGSCLDVSSLLVGGNMFERRLLQMGGKSNMVMRRMLKVVGGTKFLNKKGHSSRILPRRLDDWKGLNMFFLSLQQLFTTCIHLPTNFAASCGYEPDVAPEESYQSTQSAQSPTSSAIAPFMPMLSLIATTGSAIYMIF